MSTLTARVDTSSIAILEAKRWRDDIVAQLQSGARALTLFGQRHTNDVIVTCVLLTAESKIKISRTRVGVEFGYHAITADFPAFHCFERELHEQTGVRISGHPWMKPIRYENGDQAAMAHYPFYKVEGKEVHEVAVGPIHAGVIEPGSFRFMCLGEQVHHLEIHLGYQHRGVEKRLLEGDPTRLAPVVETIAGDTSIANAWAYAAAIESLSDCDIALPTRVARGVALELERVAMHLATLSGLAADIGFLQGATTYGRLRTTAINTTMRLCGSRFGRTAITPGAIRMRMTPELLRDVLANLDLIQKDIAIINDRFFGAQTVRHRLRGVGTLTHEQAHELGVVGVVARASGVRIDTRTIAMSGPYDALAVPQGPETIDGDCWARAVIRRDEITTSLAWIANALEFYSSWNEAPAKLRALAPNQIVVSITEGFRGEVVHCIETNSAGAFALYKVQDPSLRNWMGLAIAVRKNEISDFPICNKSFDLSYCGNDL